MSDADTVVRATRSMSIVTAVMTALVAFNTLVYSCSSDRAARENAALERVGSDERFWIDAMKELGELISSRPPVFETDRNWVDRCSLLARRAVSRRDPGGAARNAASSTTEFESVRAVSDRAGKLQEEFESKIGDSGVVGSVCASAFDDEERLARHAEAAEVAKPTEEAGAIVDPVMRAAIAGRNASIELTPVSANGWDFDIFWCERSSDPKSDGANMAEALKLGYDLAGRVNRAERLAGERLGRVRVRKLSDATQRVVAPAGYLSYPSSGSQVRFDERNAAERKLADAVRALSGASPVPQRTPSAWYVSVFFCNNGASVPSPDTSADGGTAVDANAVANAS